MVEGIKTPMIQHTHQTNPKARNQNPGVVWKHVNHEVCFTILSSAAAVFLSLMSGLQYFRAYFFLAHAITLISFPTFLIFNMAIFSCVQSFLGLLFGLSFKISLFMVFNYNVSNYNIFATPVTPKIGRFKQKVFSVWKKQNNLPCCSNTFRVDCSLYFPNK